MFNVSFLSVIGFLILIASAYLNAKLFIKYELEGVKSEKLHICTAIFTIVALVGAFVILGIFVNSIA